MTIPLQNFVDQVGPTVGADWLNGVDQTVNQGLGGLTTQQAIAAWLGVASPVNFPIGIAQGGTGAITAAAALTALGGVSASQFNPLIAAETTAGVTPINFQYPPGVPDRYATNTVPGTTDMTAACQAALAQAGVAGGWMPSAVSGSTYLITTSMNIPQNVFWNLQQSTLVVASGSGNNIFSLMSSRIGLANGYLDTHLGGGSAIYSNTTGIQQFTFRDLYFYGGVAATVNLANCYSGEFDNCWFAGDYSSTGAALVLYSNISSTPTNSIWIRGCNFVNYTGPNSAVSIIGGSGIWITDGSFQSNVQTPPATSNDISVTGNSYVGSDGVFIERCYFEDGANKKGNIIYLGGSNTYFVGGIRVKDNYFQTSRDIIYADTNTGNDLEVSGNIFIAVTGLTVAAVQTSITNFLPSVHDNYGSVAEISRTFTPTLLLGGSSTGMTGTFLGRVSRNGNLVWGEVKIVLSALGSSTGAVTIGGLPVAAASGSYYNQCTCNLVSGMTALVGTPTGVIQPGNQYINLFNQSSTGSTTLLDTNLTSTSTLDFAFRYEI